MLNDKIKSKKRKGQLMFVQTYDIIYLQTALVQDKDFSAHALKNILELDKRLDRIRRNYKGARLNADLSIKLRHLVGDVSAIGRIQSNSLNENLDDKFNT